MPYALAGAGAMVPEGSDIACARDLAGKSIGIAGGPADRSWIALQAHYTNRTGATQADKVAGHRDAITGFPGASFEARDVLANGDAAWKALRKEMGSADNDTLFETLGTVYRAGIAPGYTDDMIDAAAAAFAIMAEYGGPDLTGDGETRDPGAYWSAERG